VAGLKKRRKPDTLSICRLIARHGEGRKTVRVKNLNGAALSLSSGVGGLSQWEKVSGQNAWMCFVKGCIKRPSVVGLVQKDTLADKTWYLVPLCDDCNQKRGQDLDIWDAPLLFGSGHSVVTSARTRTSSSLATS